MIVIGFSGKKQSGKDTAVNFLKGKFGDRAHVIRFADFLKEIVHRCFDVPYEDMESEEIKNLSVAAMNMAQSIAVGDLRARPRTLRQLLQYLGTDMMRELNPDCWIAAWKSKVAELPGDAIVLVPDVRFPNEADLVLSYSKGIMIRLTRDPSRTEDTHISETALDNYHYFDITLDNRKMNIPEQNQKMMEWLDCLEFNLD